MQTSLTEVGEGRSGRSEPWRRSARVRCRSAWLLHFGAALLLWVSNRRPSLGRHSRLAASRPTRFRSMCIRVRRSSRESATWAVCSSWCAQTSSGR